MFCFGKKMSSGSDDGSEQAREAALDGIILELQGELQEVREALRKEQATRTALQQTHDDIAAKLEKIRLLLICPLTSNFPPDPVVASDGWAYSEGALLTQQTKGDYKSPKTGDLIAGRAHRSPLVRALIATLTGKQVAAPKKKEPGFWDNLAPWSMFSGADKDKAQADASKAAAAAAAASSPGGGGAAGSGGRTTAAHASLVAQVTAGLARTVMQGAPIAFELNCPQVEARGQKESKEWAPLHDNLSTYRKMALKSFTKAAVEKLVAIFREAQGAGKQLVLEEFEMTHSDLSDDAVLKTLLDVLCQCSLKKLNLSGDRIKSNNLADYLVPLVVAPRPNKPDMKNHKGTLEHLDLSNNPLGKIEGGECAQLFGQLIEAAANLKILNFSGTQIDSIAAANLAASFTMVGVVVQALHLKGCPNIEARDKQTIYEYIATNQGFYQTAQARVAALEALVSLKKGVGYHPDLRGKKPQAQPEIIILSDTVRAAFETKRKAVEEQAGTQVAKKKTAERQDRLDDLSNPGPEKRVERQQAENQAIVRFEQALFSVIDAGKSNARVLGSVPAFASAIEAYGAALYLLYWRREHYRHYVETPDGATRHIYVFDQISEASSIPPPDDEDDEEDSE